jgi:hypothetical protein
MSLAAVAPAPPARRSPAGRPASGIEAIDDRRWPAAPAARLARCAGTGATRRYRWVLPVLSGQTRFAAEVGQADQPARTAIPG